MPTPDDPPRLPLPSARVRWAAAALLALVVVAASLVPAGGTGALAPLAHLVGYAALALALAVALEAEGRSPWVVLGGAFAAALAVGVAVELVQPLVGRHRELADALLDAAGAALALAAYRLGHRWLRWA